MAEARLGREVRTAIEDLLPEVVFLDVQMLRLHGFGVLVADARCTPRVIRCAVRPPTTAKTRHSSRLPYVTVARFQSP